METIFVNEYRHDEDYMKEAVRATVGRYVFPASAKLICAVSVVLGAFLLIRHRDTADVVMGVISLLFVLCIPRLLAVRHRKELKAAETRLSTLQFPIGSVLQNSVTEDRCFIHSDKEGSLGIYLSDLCDHYESRNYFFLNFRGGVFVPFDKDRFQEGSSETFREFLKKYPKRNPLRPTICSLFLLLMIIAQLILIIG